MILTRKYVYHPYQVYRSTEVHLVHVLFSPFHFLFLCCWQIPLFRALKINGNENSKVFERRTKPFHGIMLLWTMRSVHRTMGVFAVPDQTTRNSKVGYGHIWTGHHKRNSGRISEMTDFSLFGASAPLWSGERSPKHKQNLWRILSIWMYATK